MAWQRLEHYLRRFQLSPVECSIEVLAPTFSTVPIHILKKSRDVDKASLQQQESKLTECLDDDPEEDHVSPKMIAGAFLARRKAVQEMAQRYDFFRRPLQLQNIAHSVHDIRIKSSYSCPSNPKMILNVIVSPHEETMSENSQDSTACLELVRMVNSVPLLDGAESFACGLVKSLQSSVLWASFGLTIVESIDSATNSWTSHFAIRDSDRVAPFLRSRNHQLWEAEQDHDSVGGENPEEKGTEKRKRETNDQMLMLPAKVRLGKILLLVNVDAVPTVLPLPTLSKGRLPINHLPITQALHLALRDCLRSLQQTSPGLFLTTAQLRTIERDEIYIPLMASAASGILGRMLSVSRQHKLLEKVHKIQMEDGTGSLHSRKTDMVSSGDEVVLTITSRTILLIRKIESERKKKKRQIKSSKDEDQSNDEYFDIEKVENDGQKRCAQSNESEESKSALAITWDDSDIGKDFPAFKSNLNTLLQHEESEKSPRNEIISEGIGDDYDSDDEWW